MTQADSFKSPKGSVKPEYVDGYVRLRWRADGKRYAKNIGRDTPENRKVAEVKARQIELDIVSGNFDPTLEKYFPKVIKFPSDRAKEVPTLDQLWQRYRIHLRSQEGAVSRLSISRTKQRLILVVA